MRALGWNRTKKVMAKTYTNDRHIFFGPAYSFEIIKKQKKLYRNLGDTSTKQTLAHQVYQLCQNKRLSLNIFDGINYLEQNKKFNKTIKEKFVYSSYLHLPTNDIELLEKKVLHTPCTEYIDETPKEGYAQIYFPDGVPKFSAMTPEQKSYLNLKYEVCLRDGKASDGQANQKMVSDEIDEAIDDVENLKSHLDVILTRNQMMARHLLEYGLSALHYFGPVQVTLSTIFNTEDALRLNYYLLLTTSNKPSLPKKIRKLLTLRYMDTTIDKRVIDHGWSRKLARLVPVHCTQYTSAFEPKHYISLFISKCVNRIRFKIENVTLLLYAFKHVVGVGTSGYSRLVRVVGELRRIGPGVLWATLAHAAALAGCALLLSLFGTVAQADVQFGAGYRRAAKIGLAKRENGIRKFVGAFGKALKRGRAGDLTMCAREMAGQYRVLTLEGAASALAIGAAVATALLADDAGDCAEVLCEIGDGAVLLSLEKIPDYRMRMENLLAGFL